MNVLILGKDPSILESSPIQGSDTLTRHKMYARQLSEDSPNNSSVRMIVFTRRSLGTSTAPIVIDNLCLYPTNSLSRLFYLFDAVRVLSAVLKSWRPDLVTFQEPWEEGLLGILLCRIIKRPSLAQVHFDYGSCWNRPGFLLALKREVGNFVLRRATVIRVVSRASQKSISNTLAIPLERVPIVPVGVSFQPVERKLGVRAKQQKGTLGVPYEKIVLFVGRLCAEKNLKLWLDVARIILRHDRSVGFVIVGDGPLRRILEQTSVSLNIQSNVTFVGAIPYEQISQFYSIADVFLLTSKTEGLGRVLIEAGLGGVPAVATRCGGPEDLVVDGITGFLCREGHADELAQRCLDLLKDPQLAHQMGQGAKQHLSNSYSVENTGKQLVSLWRSTGRFQQSD